MIAFKILPTTYTPVIHKIYPSVLIYSRYNKNIPQNRRTVQIIPKKGIFEYGVFKIQLIRIKAAG